MKPVRVRKSTVYVVTANDLAKFLGEKPLKSPYDIAINYIAHDGEDRAIEITVFRKEDLK